jgi:hypothetical protein
MSQSGPKLPTWASQEFVSYLRYCGRACRTAAIDLRQQRLATAFDRKLPKLAKWKAAGAVSVLILETSDIALAGRKSIERGAAAWRRSKILMHRQPDAELELECCRQHALEIGVTPRQRRLTEADSDPRPDRHRLRDVAFRPESRTAPR